MQDSYDTSKSSHLLVTNNENSRIGRAYPRKWIFSFLDRLFLCYLQKFQNQRQTGTPCWVDHLASLESLPQRRCLELCSLSTIVARGPDYWATTEFIHSRGVLSRGDSLTEREHKGGRRSVEDLIYLAIWLALIMSL
jgi:hypothetical protein